MNGNVYVLVNDLLSPDTIQSVSYDENERN